MRINEITSVDKANIKLLLKRHFYIYGRITIDENGLVSCTGIVYLNNAIKVNKLPVKFLKVGGFFNCGGNELTSLEGGPQSVGGFFNCGGNELTSLEGGPQSVGDYFSCSSNELTSLKGCPHLVRGSFYCDDNQLTSLEGGPQTVGNGFDCNNNPLITLKGLPTRITQDLYLTYSSDLPLMRALVAKQIIFWDNKDQRVKQIQEVLNKYAGQGKAGMMKCSSELLTLGKELGVDLRQNARW